jgi:bifunctional DNA primase/polymerase-like protein
MSHSALNDQSGAAEASAQVSERRQAARPESRDPGAGSGTGVSAEGVRVRSGDGDSSGGEGTGGGPGAQSDRARPDGVTAALALAARGFAVFPLRPGTKFPAVLRDWEGQATADADRLRELVRPAANVGVACGPSRLLVLDLDVAKQAAAHPDTPPEPDEPRHGAQSLRALAAGRELPATLTVATPTGGRHLYYQAPRGFRLRNTVGRLGPLIDTRASGGYVVGPGSVVDGRSYRVTADLPVAPLPRWLLHELRALSQPPIIPASAAGHVPASAIPAGNRSNGASAYAAAALRNEVERVRGARVGTRNDTLNRAAFSLGRLVGAGVLDRELATGELMDAGRQAGLPPREIASTVLSGLSAGIARPRVPSRSQIQARPPIARPGSEGRAPSSEAVLLTEAREATERTQEAEIVGALRAVDRAYDAAALRAAGLSTNRDWRRLRALADALRDVRDAVGVNSRQVEDASVLAESGEAAVRRAMALCHKISALASGLAAGFPASGRRSPLGRALRGLDRAAQNAVRMSVSV